jgi:hypothetical protein
VSARRARLGVAIVGLLGILVLLLVVGSRSAPRQLGSNLVLEREFPVVVPGGAQACQAEASVPGGSGTLVLLVGTYGRPGPPLAVRVTRAGRPVSATRVAPGWTQGRLTIPMPTVRRDTLRAEVCVRNRGARRIALGGRISDPKAAARIAGRSQAGQFRIEYLTAGPQSWWSFFDRLPDRVASVRAAVPGAATFWIWIALLLAVAGSVAALLVSGVAGAAEDERGDGPDA